MYKPLFNQVLVEIDRKDAEWGGGNNDDLLGASYRQGTFIDYGTIMMTAEHCDFPRDLDEYKGKYVMWNEGHEAGKTFEHEGKLYGFVYWWDLVSYEQ